jgi:hypothetical protein
VAAGAALSATRDLVGLAQGPLEAFEPAQRHGTRLVVRLDDDYLAAGAGLPIDPAGFSSSCATVPARSLSNQGLRPGRAWK